MQNMSKDAFQRMILGAIKGNMTRHRRVHPDFINSCRICSSQRTAFDYFSKIENVR